MAGSAYLHSPPLSLIADFNHAITYLFSHVLRNYIFHNLIVGQLASPIDLLTKRHQAERHAGVASVEQDASHSEFSCSLYFTERFQIVLWQLTQAVGQKYNVGILKAGVHELDRLIQGLFEIRAIVEKCLGGVHHRSNLSYNMVYTSQISGGLYMKVREYAYIRVSSRDQNEERQKIAMEEYGIIPDNIYMDKQSGKDFVRPGYQQLLQKLSPGDIVVIKSIDRLGRNYNEILDQWRLLTKQKQVNIIVLDMPLLNTKQGKDLTGIVIADIVLQLLSYVAQAEREFNRQRQAEGIAAAKSRGVQFGRRRICRPEKYSEIKKAWDARELTAEQAANSLGISRTTFFKWVRSEEA